MIRKFAMTLVFIGISVFTFARESQTEVQSFWKDTFTDQELPVYLVAALVVVVAVLVTAAGIYTIRILNMLTVQAEQEKAKKLGVAYVPKPSWWQRFSQQMNASVPVEHEKTIELDHSYDGIKELDNHLPPWWKWLFYGTIGWSVVYLLIFHVFASLPLSEGEYRNEVAWAEDQARKLKAMQPRAEIDENALVFSPDSVSIIASGQKVFMDNNCGSCHRNDGGGNAIGPNLTDEYWLHGGHIKNVFGIIKNGVVDKGMPAWGKGLSPQQVRDVSYFVLSLQGTKPGNAKAAQGELYREAVVKSDSLKIQASL